MTYPETTKKRESGRRSRVNFNHNCCACRKHLKQDGSVNYVHTSFCCSICKIPLCRENRIYLVAERTITFLKEHVNSDETHVCYNDFTHCRNFTIVKMINSHPLGSRKKRNNRWWMCLHQFFVVIFSYY